MSISRWGLAFLGFLLIGQTACRKREAPIQVGEDMASLEMLSDVQRAQLRRVAENPAGAAKTVRELMASPEVFVRVMTLARMENWPPESALPVAIEAMDRDSSSLVRARALQLAWKEKGRLHWEEPSFEQLVDATMARLKDTDEEVFSQACEKLELLEDTRVFADLPAIIGESPDARKPRLFSLFCKKDLTPDDVSFILENDTQLGDAAPACREQVARARKQKFIYE